MPLVIDDDNNLPVTVTVQIGQANYFIDFDDDKLVFKQIEDPSWAGAYTIMVVLTDSVGNTRNYSIIVNLEYSPE